MSHLLMNVIIALTRTHFRFLFANDYLDYAWVKLEVNVHFSGLKCSIITIHPLPFSDHRIVSCLQTVHLQNS